MFLKDRKRKRETEATRLISQVAILPQVRTVCLELHGRPVQAKLLEGPAEKGLGSCCKSLGSHCH